MLKYRDVGKKQDGSNERWQYVWEHIAEIKPRAEIEALLDAATAEIKAVVAGKNVAYSWSGGKDSIVLQIIMERLGIERCIFAMTKELEYPEFLQWVTDNMPLRLDVIASEHTYEWLVNHQDWIFPENGQVAGKWFAGIQHKAQATFFHRYSLDLLILGRRHADRNYTGVNGLYTTQGVTRYCPIRHFSQEDILAICHYYQRPMPPFYRWVNGWVCGTGCWPARQWTKNGNGWDEIWSIDPSIVHKSAQYDLRGARAFLEGKA